MRILLGLSSGQGEDNTRTMDPVELHSDIMAKTCTSVTDQDTSKGRMLLMAMTRLRLALNWLWCADVAVKSLRRRSRPAAFRK